MRAAFGVEPPGHSAHSAAPATPLTEPKSHGAHAVAAEVPFAAVPRFPTPQGMHEAMPGDGW